MHRIRIIAVTLLLTTVTSGSSHGSPHSSDESGRPEETASAPFERFHHDLKDSFANLFSEESLRPLLFGLSGAAAVAPADDRVAGYFLGPNDFPDISSAGDWVAHAEVIAGSVGALLLLQPSLPEGRMRQMAYSMSQALVVNNALSFGLKAITSRARPNRANQFSFPSGHSSNAWMTAVIANHYYGPVAGIPAYALAGLVSLSRLEANEHFTSDVIAGGVIGYLVARSVLRHAEARNPEDRLSWVPVLSPARREIGVALRFRP